METCEIPRKDMLPNPVYLELDKGGLDFQGAWDAAKNLAQMLYYEPMLLSWFDKNAGKYSPQAVTCCREDMPGWVEYARSRGGNFSVNINHEQYIFIFRGGEEKP